MSYRLSACLLTLHRCIYRYQILVSGVITILLGRLIGRVYHIAQLARFQDYTFASFAACVLKQGVNTCRLCPENRPSSDHLTDVFLVTRAKKSSREFLEIEQL